jgi:hypothetical protein
MSALRVFGLAIAFGLTAISIAAAGAPEPIKEGDTLTGKLRLVATRHPNGTKLETWQIVSAARAMPKGDDFCDYDKGATTFHLFTTTDAAKRQLKPLLGKTISVKANALFCSETAWHTGDVAVPQWELLPK